MIKKLKGALLLFIVVFNCSNLYGYVGCVKQQWITCSLLFRAVHVMFNKLFCWTQEAAKTTYLVKVSLFSVMTNLKRREPGGRTIELAIKESLEEERETCRVYIGKGSLAWSPESRLPRGYDDKLARIWGEWESVADRWSVGRQVWRWLLSSWYGWVAVIWGSHGAEVVSRLITRGNRNMWVWDEILHTLFWRKQ